MTQSTKKLELPNDPWGRAVKGYIGLMFKQLGKWEDLGGVMVILKDRVAWFYVNKQPVAVCWDSGGQVNFRYSGTL